MYPGCPAGLRSGSGSSSTARAPVQRTEEALHDGIVVAAPFIAHTAGDGVLPEQILEVITHVLNTAV